MTDPVVALFVDVGGFSFELCHSEGIKPPFFSNANFYVVITYQDNVQETYKALHIVGTTVYLEGGSKDCFLLKNGDTEEVS